MAEEKTSSIREIAKQTEGDIAHYCGGGMGGWISMGCDGGGSGPIVAVYEGGRGTNEVWGVGGGGNMKSQEQDVKGIQQDIKRNCKVSDLLFAIAMVIVIIGGAMIVGGLIYVDWWAFNQKYPDASFWAWMISRR